MHHHPHAKLRAFAASALAVIATFAAPATHASVFVPPDEPHVQYMGHWDMQPSAATTNNSGSSILFGFTGRHLTAQLAPSALTSQHRGEIYVSILKSDLTNVPVGNPVDFNITGTLRQGSVAVPFATGVPVRILK